jgi:hypothetical protein
MKLFEVERNPRHPPRREQSGNISRRIAKRKGGSLGKGSGVEVSDRKFVNVSI